MQQTTCVVASQKPDGIEYYQRINATPLVLAGLLAVLGLGVLAQFIFQSARARRRDFAVLRTLGLQRRQLTRAGLADLDADRARRADRAARRGGGRALGLGVVRRRPRVPPGTNIPVGTGLLLIPAALLAANLVALWPARRSLRIRPAQLLRAE